MQKLKRIALLFIVLLSSVGCDQATKSVAVNHLSSSPRLSFLNDIIRLEYAENPGAFLSLGAGLSQTTQQWLFIGFVALILIGFFLFALRELESVHTMVLVGFALFLGGGLGNIIDRFFNDGHVIDFMNVGIGNLRTGIFNVADMALMTSVVLIAVYGLRSAKEDSVRAIKE